MICSDSFWLYHAKLGVHQSRPVTALMSDAVDRPVACCCCCGWRQCACPVVMSRGSWYSTLQYTSVHVVCSLITSLMTFSWACSQSVGGYRFIGLAVLRLNQALSVSVQLYCLRRYGVSQSKIVK